MFVTDVYTVILQLNGIDKKMPLTLIHESVRQLTTDKKLREFLDKHPDVTAVLLDGNHRVCDIRHITVYLCFECVILQHGALLMILDMTPTNDAAGENIRKLQRDILDGFPAVILHPLVTKRYYERIAHCRSIPCHRLCSGLCKD